MNRMRILLTLCLLFCCEFTAFAWEAAPAATAKRIASLSKAWKGKSEKAIEKDKLRRANQPRPAWVDKTSWVEKHKGKTYVFGVGIAEGIKNQSLRLMAAEDRAGTALSKQKNDVESQETKDQDSTTLTTFSKGVIHPKSIDWYRDNANGALYALLVEVD